MAPPSQELEPPANPARFRPRQVRSKRQDRMRSLWSGKDARRCGNGQTMRRGLATGLAGPPTVLPVRQSGREVDDLTAGLGAAPCLQLSSRARDVRNITGELRNLMQPASARENRDAQRCPDSAQYDPSITSTAIAGVAFDRLLEVICGDVGNANGLLMLMFGKSCRRRHVAGRREGTLPFRCSPRPSNCFSNSPLRRIARA